ncbi:MAG: tRNA lysidine(34) synthetase TilS [Proteobacteria bacterium]|nr:tRNA lysidine(34) synthetase TilS [Pseudomonadota bacterium]
MAAAARASRRDFGTAALRRHLEVLLPGFPAVRVCVAFSAGADSTALLAALAPLRAQGLKLRAVHVDHGLQAAAASFRRQARRTARALKVPLRVLKATAGARRGESPEAAARNARYQALARELKAGEYLFTAHHEDDQLESVLLQLLRGCGIAGLAGMPRTAPFGPGTLVRPLLEVRGGTLRAWASAQSLTWSEDPSNAEERFDRNYLRARVLPALKVRWPAAAATVARVARHAAEAQGLLAAQALQDLAGARMGAALSVSGLRRLPPARRRNALRHFIASAGHPLPPARRLEALCGALLAARPDAHPSIGWEGVRAVRDGDRLALVAAAPAPAPPPPAALEWPWQHHPCLVLPAGRGTVALKPDARGPIDLDALAPVLSVRHRAGGERLRVVPGGVRRTLKGLLQEARVPPQERARLPLIYSGTQLVAVGERFLDASVRAGPRTARRGRLTLRGGV